MVDALKIGSTPPVKIQKQDQNIKSTQDAKNDFTKILSKEIQNSEIQFSSHAKKRLEERKIALNPLDMQKIREAIEAVGKKGSRESLILSDKAAFIVNVKDGKVITVMDPKEAKQSTFTNIDSTIII